MGSLWDRLTERQKRICGWLAIAAILGIALLVLQPRSSDPIPSPSIQEVGEIDKRSQKDDLERELATILNTFLAGKVTQVLLTWERGSRLNVAHNTVVEERQSGDGNSEYRKTSTAVILRNDADRKELPLIIEENEPIVRGVLVVLDHEPKPDLRLQVAEAVATVLQVPMYRIEVLFKQ